MAKPRVIISTDIGGADPDDMESMAHALLVADQWDIKGLVSTPTKHGGRASDIHKAIDAYAKDYGNLKTWSSDYPTPDHLKSIVTQGNVNVAPSAGYSYSTAGSKAIVKAAHDAKAAGEPLWVLTWGALTDVAQALHDDPSIRPTLRVLYSDAWNGQQDPNANKYVLDNHVPKGLWIVDNNSSFRGIYINSEGKEGNPFQMDQVKGHGELGDYFYESRPWGVKMGDSWTIAYLTDQANNNNPGADSWGGTYVKTGKGPNYWTDDTSKGEKIAWYNGAKHIRDHQSDIYKDMYRLFDRAKSANPNADKDDSADSGDGTKSPAPAPAPDPDSSSGGNNAVYAVDDTKYKLDPGKTLWENARYLTWNDKGADGGLHVTQVDKTSAQGVTVSWDANGTIAYKAKAGFVGTDTIGYTVVDKDGSSDTAKMVITVGNPGSQPAPAPEPEPEPEPDTSAGSGNPVNAVDDTKYKLDSGKTLWENSRYLTWNDKGADGGLKVTQVDKTSAQGVSVSWDETGTIVYKAKAGFVGTDTIGYTVVDKDGSSDSANMVITVGSGSSSPAPAPAPAPTPSAGSGNGVTAVDDSYSAQAGKTLWMNSRYFMFNDKGADGGLDVKSVDKVTAKGVDISSWGPEGSAQDGTIAYKAPSNFSGTDSFQYTLVDQDGSADVGTVFVNVVDMFG